MERSDSDEPDVPVGRGWSAVELEHVDRAGELEIAVRRADGSPGAWTPIWAVVVNGGVLVRTWRLRDTGWYGRAVRLGEARIRVPGTEAEVRVERASGPADAVDGAYRAKYGVEGARSMTTDEAVSSTLLLTPVGPRSGPRE